MVNASYLPTNYKERCVCTLVVIGRMKLDVKRKINITV